jgi:hypothetical protein
MNHRLADDRIPKDAPSLNAARKGSGADGDGSLSNHETDSAQPGLSINVYA